jgi:ParB family chromosome partitioning protein
MESASSHSAAANGAPLSVVVPSPEYQELDLRLIDESPSNPRKTFDQVKLDELAKSVAAIGLLQPIVVRISPWEKSRYETVAGARRLRAAKIAKLASVPVRIVQMSDVEVLEAQLIENDQREDVRELEQAEGYQALMKAAKLSAVDIAGKLHRSKEFVYGRLKLLDGIEEVRKALSDGKITAGHAILLCRLQPRDQKAALEECFDWNKSLKSVRSVDDWIEQHIRVPLDKAPFKLEDAALVPKAGACEDCPKRDAKRCLDPACYQSKTRALIDLKKSALAKKGEFLLLSAGWGTKPLKGGVLQRGLWEEAKEGAKTSLPGLYVDGDHTGKVIQVVRKAAPAPRKEVDWEAENRKKEEKRNRERLVRRAILAAALERVKAPLERADLEFIAVGFIDRDCDAICEARGIESEHGKGAKQLAASIPDLKPQSLGHLLIELSLAEELTAWRIEEKPERLLALAKRCKVNVDKIRASVEAELKKGPAEKKLEDLGLLPKVQTTAKSAGGSR